MCGNMSLLRSDDHWAWFVEDRRIRRWERAWVITSRSGKWALYLIGIYLYRFRDIFFEIYYFTLFEISFLRYYFLRYVYTVFEIYRHLFLRYIGTGFWSQILLKSTELYRTVPYRTVPYSNITEWRKGTVPVGKTA